MSTVQIQFHIRCLSYTVAIMLKVWLKSKYFSAWRPYQFHYSYYTIHNCFSRFKFCKYSLLLWSLVIQMISDGSHREAFLSQQIFHIRFFGKGLNLVCMTKYLLNSLRELEFSTQFWPGNRSMCERVCGELLWQMLYECSSNISFRNV